MANTVDERIVEAKFDASDFEKGVNKTVQKLEELKQSLNLKDSGKTVAEFAKDTQEGMDKAGNALERLSNRFTTFTGMLKQQILSGLVNEISSVFVNLEQSISRFVKSISSEQVSQGMNKYTEILNSVRTMTASGVDQDIAYEKIKRLAEYSDQTSYSLSQMTSGMSKLVAAGMDVDKAEKSMEGLANMAASAGVNIYDAQRAFVNFSQAYSSGKMRIQDWTSFETLNMATEPVMKIFMQAAEEVGTLTKTIDKSGKEVYKTTNKVNKAVKNGKEVATSGFRDTLSYGWLDKATMEQATAVLSYFEDLEVNLNELSDEDLKKFSTQAFQAAKEARSFADVLGTVKDVVATGWATSFEIIFGKLDKATEFFTWLTESHLADVIYSIGEFRNDVLRAWGSDFLEGGIFHAKDIENGVLGTGRDMLLDSLKNIDEMIGVVHEGIEGLFPDDIDVKWIRSLSFAENLGYNLAMMTKRFRASTEAMLDFFTVEEKNGDETKRVLKPEYLAVLQSFGKVFASLARGASAAFGIIGKLVGIMGRTFARVLVTIQPAIDAISTALDSMFAPLRNLNQNEDFFQNLENAIDNLLVVIKPLMGPLSSLINLIGEVAGVMIGLGIDSISTNIELFADALSFIIELFGGTSAEKMNEGVGIIEGWTNDIRAFGESCREGFGAIKEFFTGLFDDLRKLLGFGRSVDGGEGGFFENIQAFFETNQFVQNVKEWINQAVIDIGDWIQQIPGRISEFAAKIGDFFHGLFWQKSEENPDVEVQTPLNQWLTQAIADIKAFMLDIPNQITGAIRGIGTFIGQIWDGLFYEEKTDQYGKKIRIAKPLKQWLDTVLTDTGNFIQKIPEYVKTGIKGAGDILRTLVSALFGKNDGKDVTGNDIIDTLKKPFENITLTGILNKIRDIGREIVNQIMSLFTGSTNWQDNKNLLAKSVSDGIIWIKTKAEEAWRNVSEWFVNLPTTISEAIQSLFGVGKEVQKPVQEAYDEFGNLVDGSFDGAKYDKYGKKISDAKSPIETALEDFGATIGEFISSIPTTLLGFVNTAIEEIGKLWDLLWKALRGEGDAQASLDENGRIVEESINDAAPDSKKSTSKWEEFTQSLGETIQNLFAQIPGFITKGLDMATLAINKAISSVSDLLKADHANKEIEDAGRDAAEESVDQAADGTENADADALKEALSKLGQDLKTLITETIPTFISDGWTAIKDHAGEWWAIVNTWFDGYDISGLEAKVKEIGGQIEEVIHGMPELITTAAQWVSDKFKKKSPLQKAREEITKSFTDETGKIIDKRAYMQALKEAQLTLSDVPEESGLWTAIKGIGTSIGDAFSELGPIILDGLNRAFSWIAEQFTNFTEKLNERDKNQPFFEWLKEQVFGEGDGESAIAQAVNTLGETLKNIITTVLPNFIGAAFAELSVGIPRFIQSLLGGGDQTETENAGEEAGQQLGENVMQSMLTGYQDAVKEASPSGGVNLSWLNPLNWLIGNASAEDFSGNIEQGFDAFNQNMEAANQQLEKTEALYVNRKEKIEELKNDLRKAQKTTGFSTNQTDPDKVDKTTKEIEKLEKQIEYLESIEDELVDSALLDSITGESNKDLSEKASDGLSGFLGIFQTVGSFMTSKGGMIVAGLAMFGYAMSQIKDILSISDEVESIGYTAKWDAIKIAILGIVGVLGWVSYLSSQPDAQDPNGRLKSTMSTLDQLVAFIERIGNIIIAVSSINAGGTLADAFSSFFSMKEAKTVGKTLGTTGNFFSNLGSNLLSKIFEFGGVLFGSDILGGAFESLGESLAGVFSSIGIAVENFTSFVGPAVQELAGMAGNVATSIQTIESIQKLIEKLNDLVGVVDIAKSLNEDIGGVSNSSPDFKAEDTAAFIVSKTNSILGVLFVLGSAMTALANGIDDFSKLENPTDTINDLTDFAGSDEFFNFIQELSSTLTNAIQTGSARGMATISDTAIGLEMLANAMSVFSTGISGLNPENVAALSQAMDLFDRLATMLADNGSINQSTWQKVFSGDNSFSHFGQEIQSFGVSMKSFFNSLNALKGFQSKDVEATNQKIEAVIRVAQGMAEAAVTLGNSFNGTEQVDLFANKLTGIGSNFGAFIAAVNANLGEGIDEARLNALSNAITSIGQLMNGIGIMASGSFGDPNSIPDYINQFMVGITGSFLGESGLYAIGLTAGTSLDQGLADGINVGLAIAAAQSLAAAIEAAINDQDIHPKITPVIDLDSDAMETLKLFNQNGNVTFDTTGLNNNAQGANPSLYGRVTPDYTSVLNTISATLSGMSGGQVTIETDVSGVSVTLDTGAVVGALIGEIDSRLGRLGFYSGRER